MTESEEALTGRRVHPIALTAGEHVHLEPHEVHGVPVRPRPLDVEVEGTPRCYGDVVAVDWRETAQFPGSQPGTTGCTAYEPSQWVLVIGHSGEAA